MTEATFLQWHSTWYCNATHSIAPKCCLGNIFWPWQHFFANYNVAISWSTWNKNIKTIVSNRFDIVVYDYGVFSSLTHSFLYLPRPVSEATFLHHFNATKCTSTFAGWAIMQNNRIPLVSFVILNPCVHICLTKKKARKKGIFMVRYPTGLIGHVVVAPATFWSREMTPHSTCWVCTVSHMWLCGIGYVTVWYRIRYCVVSDTLHGHFLYIFLALEWKTACADDESCALFDIRFKFSQRI